MSLTFLQLDMGCTCTKSGTLSLEQEHDEQQETERCEKLAALVESNKNGKQILRSLLVSTIDSFSQRDKEININSLTHSMIELLVTRKLVREMEQLSLSTFVKTETYHRAAFSYGDSKRYRHLRTLTLLHHLCSLNDYQLLRYIISSKTCNFSDFFNIKTKDFEEPKNCFQIAMDSSATDCIGIFLEFYYDNIKRDGYLDTNVIFDAITPNTSPQLILLLHKYGIDFNSCDNSNGWTIVDYLCKNNCSKQMKLIMDQLCDKKFVYQNTKQLTSSLAIAIKNKSVDCVELLCKEYFQSDMINEDTIQRAIDSFSAAIVTTLLETMFRYEEEKEEKEKEEEEEEEKKKGENSRINSTSVGLMLYYALMKSLPFKDNGVYGAYGAHDLHQTPAICLQIIRQFLRKSRLSFHRQYNNNNHIHMQQISCGDSTSTSTTEEIGCIGCSKAQFDGKINYCSKCNYILCVQCNSNYKGERLCKAANEWSFMIDALWNDGWDDKGFQELFVTAAKTKDTSFMKYLTENSPFVPNFDKSGWNAAHTVAYAVKRQDFYSTEEWDVDAIRQLFIQEKINFFKYSATGNMPIHLACKTNNHLILEILIGTVDTSRKKQMINAVKQDVYWQYTPLMIAIINNSIECVRKLCNTKEVDVLTYKSKYPNYNALEMACYHNNLDIVKMLLLYLWRLNRNHNHFVSLDFRHLAKIAQKGLNWCGRIERNNSVDLDKQCIVFLTKSSQSLKSYFEGVSKKMDDQSTNKDKKQFQQVYSVNICVCTFSTSDSDQQESKMDKTIEKNANYKCKCCEKMIESHIYQCYKNSCRMTLCESCVVAVYIILTGNPIDADLPGSTSFSQRVKWLRKV